MYIASFISKCPSCFKIFYIQNHFTYHGGATISGVKFSICLMARSTITQQFMAGSGGEFCMQLKLRKFRETECNYSNWK